MTSLQRSLVLFVSFTALNAAGAASAQEVIAPPPRAEPLVFIEATGGYGVQFGSTNYLPAGTPGDYQHPIVNGPSVGGAAGVYLVPGMVALVATYDYTNAQSVDGSITGVLDRVRGSIEYHTAVLGLRLRHPIGPGAIRAEVGGGVIFPYETTVQLNYGPGLGQLPSPISGVGTRIDHYSVGFGGAALIGYEMPIFENLYLALNFRFRLFEAENSGESSELRNYVNDFGAMPPTATTTTITYGDGRSTPSTNSVQDARLQLALGAAF